MQTTAESQVIVRDTDLLGGTPVFRGTRVPFQAILDYLERGQPLSELLEDFPPVSHQAAVAALELARAFPVSIVPERPSGKLGPSGVCLPAST
jgi:uncharacterized protein (DUF433 family)